jgi:hypothetical protein
MILQNVLQNCSPTCAYPQSSEDESIDTHRPIISPTVIFSWNVECIIDTKEYIKLMCTVPNSFAFWYLRQGLTTLCSETGLEFVISCLSLPSARIIGACYHTQQQITFVVKYSLTTLYNRPLPVP